MHVTERYNLLAESWANGNRTTCIRQLRKAPIADQIRIACQFALDHGAEEATTFANLYESVSK